MRLRQQLPLQTRVSTTSRGSTGSHSAANGCGTSSVTSGLRQSNGEKANRTAETAIGRYFPLLLHVRMFRLTTHIRCLQVEAPAYSVR